jgi:hypothetical protein
VPATCLIGYTGFVGSNLFSRFSFNDTFRSSNIGTIRGKHYDLLVCAGAPAAKWKANQDPENDLAALGHLIENLADVRPAEAILISTVDVYPVTERVDESYDCRCQSNHAYGRNRLHLENAFAELFPQSQIVRLPGLFGPGLKKNVIYDLLHDNCLQAINSESVFQYYDVSRLWEDLQLVRRSGLSLVNFSSEPIVTRDILDAYFPEKKVGPGSGPPVRYDIRSLHAGLFGGTDGYCFDSHTVLDSLGKFIEMSRRGATA